MAGTAADGRVSDNYRSKFMTVFSDLVEELTEDDNNQEITDGIQHLKKVLNYNVPGGKCNRGLMVVGSLCHLVQPRGRQLTAQEERKALVLGWCVEWLQAFFLVADDIMDQSKLRRGQLCWYRQDGVGLVAINDSFLIEGSIYKLLRRHFKTDPYYIHILDMFHEMTYNTELGQCLDLLTSPSEEQVDLSRFTMNRYKAIVKYKTAFYSFYLPVGLAMHMVGMSDDQSHAAAKTILLKMGEFFQIQDDYIDCYGDPAVTGKVGTDIEENKCSWLVVQALLRVSAAQREILKVNYGKTDPDCVSKVKQLYRDLNLEQVYRDYEDSSYQSLMALIKEQTSALPSLPAQTSALPSLPAQTSALPSLPAQTSALPSLPAQTSALPSLPAQTSALPSLPAQTSALPSLPAQTSALPSLPAQTSALPSLPAQTSALPSLPAQTSALPSLPAQTSALPSLPAQIFQEFADRIYKRQS